MYLIIEPGLLTAECVYRCSATDEGGVENKEYPRMVKDNEPVRETDNPDEGEMSEAEIDKNLQDTFPSSDPPSWTLGTNHHHEERPLKEGRDKDEPPRH